MANVETVEGQPAVRVYCTQLTLSPAIVATIVCAEQTFTCLGIPAGFVAVTKPTAQTTMPCHARRSAANTVAISFVNPTAAGVTPTATENYVVFAVAPTF